MNWRFERLKFWSLNTTARSARLARSARSLGGHPGLPFQEASETFDGARCGVALGVDASAEAEELAMEAMVEVMEVINGAEAKPLEAGWFSECWVLINEYGYAIWQ